MALGAGNAMSATVEDPSRFYMRVLAWESALTTITWAVMPTCLRLGNHIGVFVGSAAALAVLLGIATVASAAEQPPKTGSTASRAAGTASIDPLTATLALVAVFLCCLRDGLAWTFADKIGTDLGFATGQQTILFAAIGFLGLIGLYGSARLGSSNYPIISVVSSVTLASLLTTGLLYVGRPLTYVALALPWTAVQFVAISYLTGLAAKIDITGRVAAASGAAFQLGYAVAPLLAGVLQVRLGYGAIGKLSIGLSILTIIASSLLAGRQLSMQSRIRGAHGTSVIVDTLDAD